MGKSTDVQIKSPPIQSFSEKDHKEFNQLIRNSFDMIVLLNGEGKQIYVSESCSRILGFHPEELTDIFVIDEFIHPDDKVMVEQGLMNIIEGANNGGAQYRHLHKNGSWVYLEAFGTNQLNDPSIQAIVLNVRDITDRKEAERKLLESERQLKELNATKDKFFSIIGHDLKNPITGIIGISDMLVESIKNGDFENTSQYAQIIYESSKLVNELLTDLLTWSKTQSREISFEPKVINLTSLIEGVIKLFSESANQKSIELNFIEKEEVFLFIDRNMIYSLLRNLISNSIKFTHMGGAIDIKIIRDHNDLELIVSDNGVGLSKKAISNLFKIDINNSSRGTLGEAGTGIGLNLCKEFTEIHGGRIWVESELGVGTSVHVSLPRKQSS